MRTGTLFFHGTRVQLQPGSFVAPNTPSIYIYLASNVDEAIWDAEVAEGDGAAHVYVVEPTGTVESVDQKPTGRPSMSLRSREPLRVTGELTEWPLYHGTRADLKPGDLIKPRQTPNYGNRDRLTKYVYFARTLDAATWGAELADGNGPGRIYIVEPTGPFEDDPNLTDKKFRGNPTKSFRSQSPLRVTGEIKVWQGHAPEALKAMRDHLAALAKLGVEPMDD